ncbi:hypothetical protein BJ165DRAFT_1533710 [Panaeolus papilionaceus]|nr:hypothetical protein BJ165DRAFT_1533710 [Panaeolus papilionaceus]
MSNNDANLLYNAVTGSNFSANPRDTTPVIMFMGGNSGMASLFGGEKTMIMGGALLKLTSHLRMTGGEFVWLSPSLKTPMMTRVNISVVLPATTIPAINHHPPFIPFRFLVASRLEYHVTLAFSSLPSPSLVTELNLQDGSFNADANIRLFLAMDEKFDIIRKKWNVTAGWPKEHDIQQILSLSSGQFIFPSTVVAHIDTDAHRSDLRLQELLEHAPDSTKENPFTSLDAIYSHIFPTVPSHHLATA